MVSAITLFGFLILTFLAIIVPFFGILLSIFQEGISKLSEQYENEKINSEKNIQAQLKKQAKKKKPNVEEIERSIKELRRIKRTAETKLSYLNPKRQILRLFLLFLVSFLGIIVAVLTVTNLYYVVVSISISVILFSLGLIILWRLSRIVVEVKNLIDIDRKDVEAKTVELLSLISQHSPVVQIQEQQLLKNIFIQLMDKEIKNEGASIELYGNKKIEVKVGVINHEKRMAKTVEMGFIFPSDFIIEKTQYYSIYTDRNGSKVVRYNLSQIQADTHLVLSPLIITPINVASYPVRTFIKGENVEPAYREILFEVREEPF